MLDLNLRSWKIADASPTAVRVPLFSTRFVMRGKRRARGFRAAATGCALRIFADVAISANDPKEKLLFGKSWRAASSASFYNFERPQLPATLTLHTLARSTASSLDDSP